MQLSDIKRIIAEELNLYYHGTRTELPFQKFDPRMDGTGIVSSGGKRYGGFFFTSSEENAQYYTEWFVATVKINNVLPNPTNSTHPPTVLQKAIQDGKNYVISDVIDGQYPSDIVVVPYANINDVIIVRWDFIGDEEFYFEKLDKFFDHEGEGYISQDSITELLRMIEVDPNYMLTIPIFLKYYQSKA